MQTFNLHSKLMNAIIVHDMTLELEINDGQTKTEI